MKNQITRFLTTLVAVLAWSSSVYAECTNAVFDGTWEVAFSDGNSCRLVFNSEGGVVANESICFDPFRGAAAPDSGTYAVASDCSATVALVVEGNTIDMAAHLASDLRDHPFLSFRHHLNHHSQRESVVSFQLHKLDAIEFLNFTTRRPNHSLRVVKFS